MRTRNPFPLTAALLPFLPIALSSSIDQCSLGTSKSPQNSSLTTCLDSSILSPSAWHPWTHQPHCIAADESPFCVFTHAASPSPHGFSIIATPDEASDALNPLQHVLDKPFFAPDKLYDPRPYEVRDIPGKGKGVVATRRIAKGRAVLVDPVRVLAVAEYPADVMREEVQELMAAAVRRLPDPAAVEGLARQGKERGGDGEEEEDKEAGEMSELEDVMLTNSFAVTVGGKEYMGLFADLARFNHACKPNAFMHFSEATLAMTIWSARDIEPGEEITITYSAAGMTSRERYETLKKVWGFECHCSLCTASPETLDASDARRDEIRSLQDKVIEIAQTGDFQKAVDEAERMLTLIEEENLTEQMIGMYEVPARLYYQVGNLEKALKYALKVKHEIDGYGVPDKLGEQRLETLKVVVERIEREIAEKQRRGSKTGQNDKEEANEEK